MRDGDPEESRKTIGPQLPPGFGDHDREEVCCGPTLPTVENDEEECAALIGPALPPRKDDREETVIGPALPPRKDDREETVIGPALPPQMDDCEEIVIGPALPPEMDDCEHFGPTTSSSECDIGPLPAKELDPEEQALEYARRRLGLESKKAAENKPVREEWLTKVPKQGVIAGLTARTFKRSKNTSEADASWEETPQTKRAATQVRSF
ncbi:hypothetical protein ANCCEY_11974 [Ancylostoma ceylanicum]|uniref:GPALPP motifs-containing protein 1 n=1 Tax=Ancylostoma ceylanicum TaxID=53326 RepID=A0A0D6LAC0_9BILA|nr:hypothetical protein ANCCEY_11974 [Ancylostoma ceylanicum]